jgi:hypothetical protein
VERRVPAVVPDAKNVTRELHNITERERERERNDSCDDDAL